MIKDTVKRTGDRMERVVEDLRRTLSTVRTGRASVSLLDPITVDYYGTQTPISQVGTLAAPDPSLLTVQPWDISLLPAIERAILASDLGLNPGNDGKIIRIPIPMLTEERRRQLARHVRKVLEDHRTALRQIRRDQNDWCKRMLKDKRLSEDDERRALEEIQKVTNRYMARVEEVARRKEAEILTV